MTLKLIIPLAGSGLTLFYLLRTFTTKKGCPKCGNLHPDRVRRSQMMKFVPCKAYHCHACGKRFYQVGSTDTSSLMPV